MSVKTFKRIVFGAARFYAQSDAGDPATKKLLGFTRGGAFKVERTVEQIEVDGLKNPTMGQNVKRDVRAAIEVNALQIDSEIIPNLYAGMAAVDGTGDDLGKKLLTEATKFLCTDYIPIIIMEAEYKDGSLLEIHIFNGLGIGNTEMSFEDKSEVVFSGELVAHAVDTGAVAQGSAPYVIKIGGEPADLETVESCG